MNCNQSIINIPKLLETLVNTMMKFDESVPVEDIRKLIATLTNATNFLIANALHCYKNE